VRALGTRACLNRSIVELLAHVGESNLSLTILRFLDDRELFAAQSYAIQHLTLEVDHFLECFLCQNVGILPVFELIIH